ncbi:TetR/AcrR family transcriptional regulator [Oerskovia flava]|uniref:TetR/AcrR family transcriptional regulator n=1 Tax=Oerskovia flava TaxID=2986422 RepID=UPI0022404ED6|nr:TetR/AcrR family transcriptional regulator [Oerskovia sp. JB1-3-2]
MTTDLDNPAVSPRRERTRERLLDAAYDEFAAQGIHAASIEAVCEAAGFTRGAFYSNFASKEELFLALADRETRKRIANLEGAVEHLPRRPARDGAVEPAMVAEVITAVMADPSDERRWHLMSAEFELLALRDPQVAARFVAQEHRFLVDVSGILERTLESIGLRFAVDRDDATRLLVSAYTAAAHESFLVADGDAAARRTRESTWLPTLVSRLVEPLEPPDRDGRTG